MINIEDLDTTSLVVIMNELSSTNKLLDHIDNVLASKELQPYEAEYYISLLNDYEKYYRALEQQIRNRGWMKENETLRLK